MMKLRTLTLAFLVFSILLVALLAQAASVADETVIQKAVRAPQRECTIKYIEDEAACSCFLFNRDNTYPPGIKSLCKKAYTNIWAQKWRCKPYTAPNGMISRDDVDEALVWTVEKCLTKPTTASRFLALSADSSVNLRAESDRLFFLPALLPIIGKIVIKTAISSGARLAAKAAAKAVAKKAAAAAAKAAAKKAVQEAAKKAAQAAARAAERALKAAQAAANAAKSRAAEVAKKAGEAQRVARNIARRIVQRAKREGRRLFREARKFGRREAKRVAKCVSEKMNDLKTGRDVLVEIDAGTVREEVEDCLKESKVVCVGIASAEVVRGEKEADSLSFFADLAICLSDNRGVCVAATTARFVDGSLARNRFISDMIGCLPDSDKCGPQIAQLVIGGEVNVERAIEQAISCDDEQREKRKNAERRN